MVRQEIANSQEKLDEESLVSILVGSYAVPGTGVHECCA